MYRDRVRDVTTSSGASANFTYDSAANIVTFGSVVGSALAMTIWALQWRR